MIRDVIRTVCVVVVLAVAASLAVEVRHRLAVIDLTHRIATANANAMAPPAPMAPAAPAAVGPLRAVGREFIDLADAMLGVVR